MPTGTGVSDVLPHLRQVLDDNDSAAWLPIPTSDRREARRLSDALAPGEPIDDEVALVVTTSGSTGVPKGAMLSAAALRASGNATHERLGGPGSWLLALPTHHIAGIQVLLRGILAGTEPTVLDVSGGFLPEALAGAVASMPGPRRYTSLVPTQLIKALDTPSGVAALAELDAVLVGGAATPVPVYERARAAGINVVRTYGMSETCGGCVYDGVPLSGVRVRIEDGRVLLGGAVLASGYRNLPDHPAFAEPGWFRTDDAGVYDNGVLRVTGRLDEAILTGGLVVIPQVVEAVLATHPSVSECVVLGLPDERLGQRVVVAVVPTPGATPTLAELREHVLAELDSIAAPRELAVLDELPLLGVGKPNRAELRRELLSDSMGQPGVIRSRTDRGQ
ncbi:o-succinylbenzoate--CoA ligase [Nocardia donostiensis]|uniref:O-succinylbenzoic acid--CoA ligase n=1 Tax=Nocardia donostiensis TaxID=1538463 RepID=A0A1W0AYG8_9NOCA|nr:o-succinylbenzoate--CoA ligase [Nocardia donostiensis]ONM47208.1 O-succinylbenzoic acid--CoA ligase [Nocardia donostiensis]OQS15295.1 O-succinylbenzoic acid--CoA ligase [Nocardia donostiensis]OQS20187.1 O-succinylbenzoic acid--CoA ligase [Nocardia donostiensis]